MTTILLIRHGHVAGIDPPRFRGRADLPLTDLGAEQAAKAARRVGATWTPSIVYTSPLGRCVKTGAAIAAACRIPSQILPGLIDLDYGEWQGKSREEAKVADPSLLAGWLATPDHVRFPDGETLQDLAARTSGVMRLLQTRGDDETIVLVGHDSVNRVMLSQWLMMPLASYWRIVQDPCCINEIELDRDTVRVRRMNDTAHLAH
jgi:probable phosphoglycerate mutase